MAKIKIAVLFGGASKDNSVSLRSAYSVLCGLSAEKYEAMPIGITRAGRWLYYPGAYEKIASGEWESDSDCCSAIISPDPIQGGVIKLMGDGDAAVQRVDVIFSVLHGKYGECGRIQSLCKLSGMAFVGCGDDAAQSCTDKQLTYLLLGDAGIKTSKYFCLERSCLKSFDEYAEKIESGLSYPMYIKAASVSAAMGCHIVRDREEMLTAVKICFSHHYKVLVEELLQGIELECAVMGNSYTPEVSVVGEVRRIGGASPYKYVTGTARPIIPAEIPAEITKQVQETAYRAFMTLNCKGFAKISFILTGAGLYVTKATNIPGFLPENLFPRLMAASGYGYSELLDNIITLALEARA